MPSTTERVSAAPPALPLLAQGQAGQRMREEILRKIDKWQEPPPAKQIKPLPRPDEFENKKRRGGRRIRKMKERYGMTDMRKAANRMHFNQPEEEYLDGDEVRAWWCLGRVGGILVQGT